MSEQNFGYRNLIVWQKAMLMTQLVYAVVKKFPTDERYALSDQLRRAVVSIASNIAEGCGRASNKDYAHFLAIARGSLYETMTQLEMAQQLGFVPNQLKFVVEGEERIISPFDTCEQLAVEIARMLGSLLKKYGAIVKSKSGVEVQGESKSRVEVQEGNNHHSSTSTSNFDSSSTSNFDSINV